jgi:hypothetical protein
MYIAVAWYRADQWAQLLQVSADAGDLESTYEQWHEQATRKMKLFRAQGMNVHEVPIDVDELLKWCEAQDRPVDAEARASFVLAKIEA